MYKIKVIDSKKIRWLKNGDIMELDNSKAESFARQGIVKILKFTGSGKQNFSAVNRQIRTAKKNILMWKEKLKKLEGFKKRLKKSFEVRRNG